MKLNNKGYLIVEVILAGVLTFTMAYFLISLTLKIRNRYDDVNVETVLLNDKTVITNEIMGDVISDKITSVVNITNGIKLNFEDGSSKDLTIIDNTIKYGTYTKKLSENAIVGNVNIKRNGNYFLVEIPITTKYSNKDYGINIVGFTKETLAPLTCNLSASGTEITSNFVGNMAYYGWDATYSGDNSTTKAIDVGTHTYYLKDVFGDTGSCSISIVNTSQKLVPNEIINNADERIQVTGSCGCSFGPSSSDYQGVCDIYRHCNCPRGGYPWDGNCGTNTIYFCNSGTLTILEGRHKCVINTTVNGYSCPDGYTKVNDTYCSK